MAYNRIILFTSYYFATKAENALMEAKQAIVLVATPESLHYACGLCILCHKDRLAKVLRLLIDRKITWSGIYRYENFSGPYEKLLPEDMGDRI